MMVTRIEDMIIGVNNIEEAIEQIIILVVGIIREIITDIGIMARIMNTGKKRIIK